MQSSGSVRQKPYGTTGEGETVIGASNEQWMHLRTCNECRKQFEILLPEIWAYKDVKHTVRKTCRLYYCSWHCLQKSRLKKEKAVKA